jgi:hypothetical protein
MAEVVGKITLEEGVDAAAHDEPHDGRQVAGAGIGPQSHDADIGQRADCGDTGEEHGQQFDCAPFVGQVAHNLDLEGVVGVSSRWKGGEVTAAHCEVGWDGMRWGEKGRKEWREKGRRRERGRRGLLKTQWIHLRRRSGKGHKSRFLEIATLVAALNRQGSGGLVAICQVSAEGETHATGTKACDLLAALDYYCRPCLVFWPCFHLVSFAFGRFFSLAIPHSFLQASGATK